MSHRWDSRQYSNSAASRGGGRSPHRQQYSPDSDRLGYSPDRFHRTSQDRNRYADQERSSYSRYQEGSRSSSSFASYSSSYQRSSSSYRPGPGSVWQSASQQSQVSTMCFILDQNFWCRVLCHCVSIRSCVQGERGKLSIILLRLIAVWNEYWMVQHFSKIKFT